MICQYSKLVFTPMNRLFIIFLYVKALLRQNLLKCKMKDNTHTQQVVSVVLIHL